MTMSDKRERKKKINLAKEKAGLIFINQWIWSNFAKNFTNFKKVKIKWQNSFILLNLTTLQGKRWSDDNFQKWHYQTAFAFR